MIDRIPPDKQRAARDRLSEERADTIQRIESLTRQFESVVESSSWGTHDDEHDPEGATVAFERAQIQALLRQARNDLGDLDRATARVREGTYFRCERCEQEITEQRLAARPAARTCIGCAQRARR